MTNCIDFKHKKYMTIIFSKYLSSEKNLTVTETSIFSFKFLFKNSNDKSSSTY